MGTKHIYEILLVLSRDSLHCAK